MAHLGVYIDFFVWLESKQLESKGWLVESIECASTLNTVLGTWQDSWTRPPPHVEQFPVTSGVQQPPSPSKFCEGKTSQNWTDTQWVPDPDAEQFAVA